MYATLKVSKYIIGIHKIDFEQPNLCLFHTVVNGLDGMNKIKLSKLSTNTDEFSYMFEQ
jgi:hypothetical protein